MGVRNYASFWGDFDDSQWDSSGNLLVPGGFTAAARVRAAIVGAGFECSPVTQHSFYGWEFTATRSGESYWCLLQSGGQGHQSWLMMCQELASLLARGVARPDTSFQSFLVLLDNAIKVELQSPGVVWRSKAEYEAGTD